MVHSHYPYFYFDITFAIFLLFSYKYILGKLYIY